MTSLSHTSASTAQRADRGGFRFITQVTGDMADADQPADAITRAEWPFQSQARRIYEELSELTSDAGALDSMCRQHIYQQDKRYYPAFERTRIEYEPVRPTPSSGIGVSLLGDRPARTYEVDGIALNPVGIERYGAPSVSAAASIGASASHYTQGLMVGPYIFTAGMIAVDPATARSIGGYEDVPEEGWLLRTGRTHPDSRTGPVATQTWSLYQRIFAMLGEHGMGPDRIASATVFLSDPGDVADFLRVHHTMFGGWASSPALQVVFVDEVGHHGTVIEIEVTAMQSGQGEIRRTWAESEGSPVLVRAGELAFSSDVLPLNRHGAPITSLDDLSPSTRDRVAHHSGALDEPLLAQIAAVSDGLIEAFAGAGVTREHLGLICLQIAKRSQTASARAVLEDLFADQEVAFTVLGGDRIGHWPGLLAAAFGVGAGLADD